MQETLYHKPSGVELVKQLTGAMESMNSKLNSEIRKIKNLLDSNK